MERPFFMNLNLHHQSMLWAKFDRYFPDVSREEDLSNSLKYFHYLTIIFLLEKHVALH